MKTKKPWASDVLSRLKATIGVYDKLGHGRMTLLHAAMATIVGQRAALVELAEVLDYELKGPLSKRVECCSPDLSVLELLYSCPYRTEKPSSERPGKTIHGCYELVAGACCACLCGGE